MALIYFYDATDLDVEQLSGGLRDTDHHWEFIEDNISLDNLNPNTEVISIFVSSTVTAEMIERLPRLKLIACRSTGFNNIDLKMAQARGVTVVNVPTYGEQTVAEYAFTLLLALSRKLSEAIASFDKNIDVTALCGWDLNGKTIGVIGTGHIGQSVIRIAKGFGMHVVGFDPYPNEQAATDLGFEYSDLDDLLRRSDVVTLHAPYTPENHHLINEEKLLIMKPSAVLVNTARGELVDTQALTEQLSAGRIAGAALDVIEGEHLIHLDEEIALLRSNMLSPDMLQHSMEIMALHKMPNVILTPHNAFNTSEAIGRINSVTCDNIIRFWYGDTPNVIKVPKPQNGKLVITRHAESEWNAEGKWTGKTNITLSDKGFHEASLLGQEIQRHGIKFDKAYCSEQVRTMETMQGILDATGQFDVPYERVAAINERDYGDFTGKNKWEVKDMIGEDEFQRIRRGWNIPVPNGETLKMVYERAVPFYRDKILPELRDGKNVLVVSHGNGIRAVMKYIESISDEGVEDLEMLFGTILVYEVDDDGKMIKKQVLAIDSPKPNA